MPRRAPDERTPNECTEFGDWPDGPLVESPAEFRGTSQVLEERPGFLRVEAVASHPGHLVIADAFAPGWTARLDGSPVPLLRANGVFRAIALPPGRHEIECRYLPASLTWGVVFSLVLALATLAVIAVVRTPTKPMS